MQPIDIVAHNRAAWSQEKKKGNRWTIPASPEEITRARRGEHALLLTPKIVVPSEWLGDVRGKDILCLASGGGQQGPVLAAMGARVTVFDNCPDQLAGDRMVANREDLEIATVQGDMRDLSAFADASFDLIFHPVSNCFVDDILPMWRECARVLRRGGALLAGFNNPLLYLFDMQAWDEGRLEVRYAIPYSDVKQLPPDQLAARIAAGETLEFGHSLTQQIGGQLSAGLLLAGLFEDTYDDLLDPYTPTFIATRAIKP